eukprot:7679112-Pyramimonas_sp.AAC.1
MMLAQRNSGMTNPPAAGNTNMIPPPAHYTHYPGYPGYPAQVAAAPRGAPAPMMPAPSAGAPVVYPQVPLDGVNNGRLDNGGVNNGGLASHMGSRSGSVVMDAADAAPVSFGSPRGH